MHKEFLAGFVKQALAEGYSEKQVFDLVQHTGINKEAWVFPLIASLGGSFLGTRVAQRLALGGFNRVAKAKAMSQVPKWYDKVLSKGVVPAPHDILKGQPIPPSSLGSFSTDMIGGTVGGIAAAPVGAGLEKLFTKAPPPVYNQPLNPKNYDEFGPRY